MPRPRVCEGRNVGHLCSEGDKTGGLDFFWVALVCIHVARGVITLCGLLACRAD